ncbi:MAG: PAS domain-containing protein [Spirochaetales bacterium]|nr:PAS domain-containing protein [Spirochaetales bacterium]
MEIKDFNYLSFSNNYEKSQYFNNLIIQKSGEYRLHYFSDTEGFFRIDKIKFPINSGAFFITHPGDHFSINPVRSKSSLGYFIIKLTPKENEDKLKDFLDQQLSQKSFQLNPNQRILLEEVLGKLNSESNFQRESARHLLISLIYDLPDYENKTHISQGHHKYIEKAVKYMHERMYKELSLSELCKHLCISEPHCIRLFKIRMGTTPMKYFTSIKIEEAISQLLSTNKPLSLIAEELNFSSPAHFSKTFKHFMSISPTQYRNNYINTLEYRQQVTIKEKEHAYDLLQTVIDAIPDLVFIKDTNGIMISGNKAICKVLGLTKDEIVGKSDYEMFPKEEADFFKIRDAIIFKHNRAYKNEEEMTYPDGRKRYFEVHKAPFHDDEGEILGLVGISRDITERIQERKKIEEARKQQKHISEHQADAMIHLSGQLSNLLDSTDFTNSCVEQDSFHATRIQLLLEGLNSYIQGLFKSTSPDKKGIDPELLFIRFENLIRESMAHQNITSEFTISGDIPDIAFTEDQRLIRALYFLIKTLTFDIDTGNIKIDHRCKEKMLLTTIALSSADLPKRKYIKIDKLIKREEGIPFIEEDQDPIELSMANIELETLSSSLQIITYSDETLVIRIKTPFPYGIEYLNQFYSPKNDVQTNY